jgi:hypothetical protein
VEREQLDKIKERIAKLLSMAKDASSPNEAAIAAQRARAMMDKYQLDEYDIKDAAPDVFGEVDVTRAFAAMPYHMDILSVAVAAYNDCQSVFYEARMDYKMESKQNQNDKLGGGRTKKFGKKAVFRGYKRDVELAKMMFDNLCANIDALCKKYMQENYPGRYSVRIGGEYKAAAARVLCAKFREMTEAREALTYSSGNALVVVKTAAVNEKFGDVEYTKKSKSSSVADYESQVENERARTAGYIDGQKIEIIKRLDD